MSVLANSGLGGGREETGDGHTLPLLCHGFDGSGLRRSLTPPSSGLEPDGFVGGGGGGGRERAFGPAVGFTSFFPWDLSPQG